MRGEALKSCSDDLSIMKVSNAQECRSSRSISLKCVCNNMLKGWFAFTLMQSTKKALKLKGFKGDGHRVYI